MKARLATEWLSACGGCHVAIVDMHDKLLKVLDAVTIVRCPVLLDVKGFPEADVGIVTGAIRTEHDRQMAEKMREACETIIAFGTCAVHGGISGAGSLHEPEDILETVYLDNRSTEATSAPTDVPPLQPSVTPLDEVIDVDLYLPGCPPHPYFVFEALAALLEGREPGERSQSVCARCRRHMLTTDVAKLRTLPGKETDPETCFLSQGRLCFGSVTLDRCLSACPDNGVICTGCGGPTMRILTEPSRDIRTEVAERMSRLTAIPQADIVAHIERFAKTHYAYAMATDMIGKKSTFLIRKWIEQTGKAQ